MPTNFDDTSGDGGVDFGGLGPSQQKELLTNMMQGKPQTPANMSNARGMLSRDPDTVASMCEKLGINPSEAQDQQNMSDDKDNGR